VVGVTSVSFTKICSIAFTYASLSMPSNLSLYSSVKSLEDNTFPSILSTFPERESDKPEILF